MNESLRAARICAHHYDPLGGGEGIYDETGHCDQCGRPPVSVEAYADVDWDADYERRAGG